MGLRSWIHARRQWKIEHENSWTPLRAPQPSGVNRFQAQCEAGVALAVERLGFALENRTVLGKDEPSIRAEVGRSGITIYIHPDTVEAYDGRREIVRIEEWDRRTADELVRDYIERLVSELASRPSAGNV